jgi:DNA-binding protein Fis
VSLYGLLADAADANHGQASPLEGPSRKADARGRPSARDQNREAAASRSLEDVVLARLREYALNLQGHAAKDMYGLIMPQLERPLVRVAMELAKGRQRHAAAMLGIHRNTLRMRLKELGLESNLGTERRPRRGR